MGADMADGAVTAGLSAGGNTITRAGGASTQSRVNALRPVSAVAPTAQAFTQALNIPHSAEIEAVITPSPEPGNGRLSSGVQLILAETRAQEDQSDFIDRSTLDQATLSYAQSQEAVRETIGFTKLAAAGSDIPPSIAPTHSEDTSA